MMRRAAAWYGSSGLNPSWARNSRVPVPSGSRVNVSVESSVLGSPGAARQARRSRFSGSTWRTSECPVPPKPAAGIGIPWKVNLWPTSSLKSLGISQRAMRSGSVRARHTFAGG